MHGQIRGLGEIAARYRHLFVDAYGVIHDGAAAFPGANDALRNARRNGLAVVIVTNSAERVAGCAARLARAGLDKESYDHVISSGELCWRHLARLNAGRTEPPVLFLLREGNGPAWLRDLPNPITESMTGAEVIVAAGLPFRTEAEAQASSLPAAILAGASAGIPMVVADSDEVYPQNGVLRLGPGWMARRYAQTGGPVVEFGKPYAPIYVEARHLSGAHDPRQVLMIGDNLRTDILGAQRQGFASLLVLTGGVHGGISAAALQAAMQRERVTPTFVADALAW